MLCVYNLLNECTKIRLKTNDLIIGLVGIVEVGANAVVCVCVVSIQTKHRFDVFE